MNTQTILITLHNLSFSGANGRSFQTGYGNIALTNLGGYAQNFVRKLKSRSGLDIQFDSFGVIMHNVHQQNNQRHPNSNRKKENGSGGDDNIAPKSDYPNYFVDIALTLFIEVSINLVDDDFDDIKDDFLQKVKLTTFHSNLSIAGGHMHTVQKSAARVHQLSSNPYAKTEAYRQILRKIRMRGAVIVSSKDLLKRAMIDNGFDSVEALLSCMTHNFIPDRDESNGWLMPSRIGFKRLTEFVDASTVRGCRDPKCVIALGEEIVGLLECVGIKQVSSDGVNDYETMMFRQVQTSDKTGVFWETKKSFKKDLSLTKDGR